MTSPSTAPTPSAAAALSPARVRAALPRGGAGGRPGANHPWHLWDSTQREREQIGAVFTRRRRPVPGAARVAAVGGDRRMSSEPDRRQVSQSCGRHTAAVRPALAGSSSASQRSLVTVNEATARLRRLAPALGAQLGDEVGRGAVGPGVVPQQGRPDDLPVSSRQTMPCCCAPTEMAATSTRPPACPEPRPALTTTPRDRPRCRPDGRHARPNNAPVSASRTTTLQDWVDESTPATSGIRVAGRQVDARRRAG